MSGKIKPGNIRPNENEVIASLESKVLYKYYKSRLRTIPEQ